VKQKAKEKKLAKRRAEYDAMVARGSHEAKVDDRIKGGGYKRPGSCK
jgi:hypothetical protein